MFPNSHVYVIQKVVMYILYMMSMEFVAVLETSETCQPMSTETSVPRYMRAVSLQGLLEKNMSTRPQDKI